MATRSADILPLYKIGVVFGILTLRLNPNKLHRKSELIQIIGNNLFIIANLNYITNISTFQTSVLHK